MEAFWHSSVYRRISIAVSPSGKERADGQWVSSVNLMYSVSRSCASRYQDGTFLSWLCARSQERWALVKLFTCPHLINIQGNPLWNYRRHLLGIKRLKAKCFPVCLWSCWEHDFIRVYNHRASTFYQVGALRSTASEVSKVWRWRIHYYSRFRKGTSEARAGIAAPYVKICSHLHFIILTFVSV